MYLLFLFMISGNMNISIAVKEIFPIIIIYGKNNHVSLDGRHYSFSYGWLAASSEASTRFHLPASSVRICVLRTN